jgi:hypothetical protein
VAVDETLLNYGATCLYVRKGALPMPKTGKYLISIDLDRLRTISPLQFRSF